MVIMVLYSACNMRDRTSRRRSPSRSAVHATGHPASWLVRLIRDLDHEKQAVVNRARMMPWRRPLLERSGASRRRAVRKAHAAGHEVPRTSALQPAAVARDDQQPDQAMDLMMSLDERTGGILLLQQARDHRKRGLLLFPLMGKELLLEQIRRGRPRSRSKAPWMSPARSSWLFHHARCRRAVQARGTDQVTKFAGRPPSLVTDQVAEIGSRR